jgi:ribosomal-protein-alanine N-acetyltransferase
MKIELREPLISDAKRYFEILSHPEFYYFPAKPATLKEEKEFLRKSKSSRKNGAQYNFAIIANGKHVGGAGIKINQQYPYLCEIGYFVDRKYWNKGISTKTVELLEKFIVEKLNIVRIEIITAKENVACQRVAVKSGYKKEGLLKKRLKIGNKFHDCYLFAKILKS